MFSGITLLGGLAFFLYGMTVMGTGLEKLSGGRLEQILEKFTNNIFKGVALGALVTAAIQSSSATTVIVVGLVNAKILKLRQAIGVIMGANIGTTITAHILRLTQLDTTNIFIKFLKPTTLAPLMAIGGILLFMISRRSIKRDMGQMMLGFGILFMGMFQMEAAVAPLRDLPEFYEMFAAMSNPVLGVLVGTVVTGVIQSSAASIGILQALSSTGAITFAAAFPIIMGQNIGTCVTPLMASIGASRNAKRAAFIHLIFNILGTVTFLLGTYAIQYFVGFPFWSDPISSGGIANFHSIFNIVVTLLFIPLAGMLEKIVCLLFKETQAERDGKDDLILLDERLMVSPGLAIDHSRKAAVVMGELAQENLNLAISMINDFDHKAYERLRETENTIDKMEDKLEGYLLELSKRELNDIESRGISEVLHVIGEFEHVGDQAENIGERAESLYQSGNHYSEDAMGEMEVMTSAVQEILQISIEAYKDNDHQRAKDIEPLEEVIDLMEETLKSMHIRRLREGHCSVDAAFPFVETLSSLEKIADYCSNIGVMVIGRHKDEASQAFDHHEYLRSIHKGDTEDYAELYRGYELKYFSRIEQQVLDGFSEQVVGQQKLDPSLGAQ